MAAAESYPDDLRYHREHDWARIDGDEATLGITWFAQDSLGELVHFEPPEEGATVAKDAVLRRGRVGEGGLGCDRAALRRGRRGQPARSSPRPRRSTRTRTARAGSIRIRLDRPVRGRRAARRRGVPGGAGRAVSAPYLSLTDADRERDARGDRRRLGRRALRDMPPGVRFGRELDLEPPLSELELVAHLERARRRGTSTRGSELSFLGAGHLRPLRPGGRRRGARARRAPDRVHAVPARDEPGRAAGDLRVPDRDLRAHGHGRLQRVAATTGRPSPPTPATSRSTPPAARRVVVAETVNPQVRQVVKTYAPGFGLEVVEVPHDGGVTDPGRARARPPRTPPCVIFQQPNFFGCLEPAPELAAAANEAGALPVAHVDPMSLGVLEAPGAYGCAMAIGEGQARGQRDVVRRPALRLPGRARRTLIRRMPGRIVGETTDVRGAARLCPDPADPRAAHPPREGDLEHHDEPDAARARRARLPRVARPAGAHASWGRPAWRLAAVREGAARPPARVRRTANVQGVCRARRTARARGRSRAARERGVHPGYALGRDYAGLEDALLVCRDGEAHAGRHRPARRGAREVAA